jgi:hypothetical protein
MSMAKRPASTVSNKGQIIQPKDGVLQAARPLPPTTPEDVFGRLDAKGKRLSDDDIKKALRAAAKRRHARD